MSKSPEYQKLMDTILEQIYQRVDDLGMSRDIIDAKKIKNVGDLAQIACMLDCDISLGLQPIYEDTDDNDSPQN